VFWDPLKPVGRPPGRVVADELIAPEVPAKDRVERAAGLERVWTTGIFSTRALPWTTVSVGVTTRAAWVAKIFALMTDWDSVAFVRVWMSGRIGVAAAALNFRNCV